MKLACEVLGLLGRLERGPPNSLNGILVQNESP